MVMLLGDSGPRLTFSSLAQIEAVRSERLVEHFAAESPSHVRVPAALMYSADLGFGARALDDLEPVFRGRLSRGGDDSTVSPGFEAVLQWHDLAVDLGATHLFPTSVWTA